MAFRNQRKYVNVLTFARDFISRVRAQVDSPHVTLPLLSSFGAHRSSSDIPRHLTEGRGGQGMAAPNINERGSLLYIPAAAVRLASDSEVQDDLESDLLIRVIK
jgi:hypothetical protein